LADYPLQNMQQRADQCRRLAAITHDERMSYQLLDWAAEIEADIERLEAQLKAKRGDRL
jgi:hypothetical protein